MFQYLNSFNWQINFNFYLLSYVLIVFCIGYLAIRVRNRYYDNKAEFYLNDVVDYIRMNIKIQQCYVNFRNYYFEMNNIKPIKEFIKQQKMVYQECEEFRKNSHITLYNKEYLRTLDYFLDLCNCMIEMFEDMISISQLVEDGKKLNIKEFAEYMDSGDLNTLNQNIKKNIIEETDKDTKNNFRPRT